MPELVFKGKEFVYNHHLSVPVRPLVPHEEKGIGPVALDGNLIIQGDNLHALKSLLPLYAGKVDCIFIDPPYNTGEEGWSYNDNVNSPIIKEWLTSNPVNSEDMLRHDKWCCMMWPRLRILHELLADQGSIWITLDYNELHRAHAMLEEIFGETNYVSTIVWQKRTSPDSRKNLAHAHDYCIVFAKNSVALSLSKVNLGDARISDYKNPDNDPRKEWASVDLGAQAGHATPDQFYDIIAPNGKIHKPAKGRCWGVSEKTYLELFKDNRIYFGKDGNAKPRIKKFLSEAGKTTTWTWWSHDYAGSNEDARKELDEILVAPEGFETPKPSQLLARILDLAAAKPDALVLDSFAGSGTTAHAVLKMNKLDGGNRRFILVECEDYADSLTAERVRRVVRGYEFKGTHRTELLRERLNWKGLQKMDDILRKVEDIEGSLFISDFDKLRKEIKDADLLIVGEKIVSGKMPGLDGTFTYCTLGDPIELDKVLSGETLPPYDGLGSALFHMATNRAIDPGSLREKDFYLGSTEGQHVWLIYKPDLEWLKSPEAALTLARAKAFAETDPNKKHLVFAPARFVSQKMLSEQNIPVEFVPLPFALYRIDRS